MKFEKYKSIENSYRSKFMNFIDMEGFSSGTWHVLEKVHGSNFSIWYDGNEMKAAKRSAFLSPTTDFYNYEKIINENKKNIEIFWKYLIENGYDLTELVIYGEIFGGNYPDMKIDNAKKIQKGIFYHPDNKFIAFDIKTDGVYLDVDVFEYYCDKFNIPYLPTLFMGTLEECLKYPNDYQSTISAMYGLPKIKNNTCEGNVIKPTNPVYLNGGSRVIVKNKNEKWSEKNKEKKVKIAIKLSDNAKEHFKNIITFLTENRLRNIISKLGKVNQKEFGKLLGLFVKDTLEEYLKDNNLDNLEKKERKVFNRMINAEASNIIRPNFQNIINGEF